MKKGVSLNCVCKTCNKKFHIKQYAINRGRGIFCSKACQYKYKTKKIKKICNICGILYIVKISDHIRNKAQTCSNECKGKNKTIKSGILNKIKLGIAKGERHWNWRGGVTAESEKIRRSKKYYNFRKQIFERDNYVCRKCKKRGGKLQVEHIKPFSLFPELIYDEDNCITLCLECHKKTDTFGYKLSYKIKKYGKEKLKKIYEVS